MVNPALNSTTSSSGTSQIGGLEASKTSFLTSATNALWGIAANAFSIISPSSKPSQVINLSTKQMSAPSRSSPLPAAHMAADVARVESGMKEQVTNSIRQSNETEGKTKAEEFAPASSEAPAVSAKPQLKSAASEESSKKTFAGVKQQLIDFAISKNPAKFKETMESIFKENKPEVLGQLLEELALKTPPDEYNAVMDMLTKQYPSLCNCFDRLHDANGNALGLSLNLAGLKIMVEHFKKQGDLTTECIVCDSYEDFKKKLELVSAKKDVKCTFIVRHFSKEFKKVHVTPIYFENKNGKANLIITDSTGDTVTRTVKDPMSMGSKEEKTYITGLTNSIKDAMPGAVIHYFTKRRQHDQTNCPIFALTDVIHMSKHPNILDFVQARSIVAEKNPSIRSFDELPPEMMSTAQSRSDIEKYLGIEQVNKESGSAGTSKMTVEEYARKGSGADPKKVELAQVIAHHTVSVINKDGKPKQINAFAANQFTKFSRMVIAKAFEQSTHSPSFLSKVLGHFF